jgi:hypothetical protein
MIFFQLNNGNLRRSACGWDKNRYCICRLRARHNPDSDFGTSNGITDGDLSRERELQIQVVRDQLQASHERLHGTKLDCSTAG